jgi:hypothetical protein
MARAWTEAFVLSRIRAVLRRLSMQMPAVRLVKLANRRPYTGPNKRLKFEYRCEQCNEWFPEAGTQVDHKEPAGPLKTFEDVGPFARRLLFCGTGGLQVLCTKHHNEKTQAERKARRNPTI